MLGGSTVAWGAGVTVAGDAGPPDAGRAPGRAASASRGPDRMATASRRSWRRPPTRPGRPGEAPGAGLRVHGQLRVRPGRRWSRRWARTRPTTAAGTAWAATSSRCWSGTAPRTSTTSCGNQVPGAAGRDAGYWRDAGHAGRLLRRAPGPVRGRPAVPPVQRPLADPDPGRAAAAGQVRHGTTRASRGRRSAAWSATASSSRAAWSATRCCRRASGWTGSAQVDQAVLLHNTQVGRRAVVRRAILDKNVVVPDGAAVGVDKEHDRARGFAVSDGGITVVGKGQPVGPLARRAEYWPRRGASTTQPGGTVPPRPPLPPVHRGDRAAEGAGGRGRLEHP